MSERCDKDCKEMNDVKRTLYGSDGTGGLVACSKKLERRKVSWVQLGIAIGVICTILGLGWFNISLSNESGIRKVESKCDSNSKQIQTYSIGQAVLTEKVQTLTDHLKAAEVDRKANEQVLHRRINESNEKLDKILEKLRKP